ncbi:Flp family type IVb pilin [Arsenicitalea aurantiaca]|uniref:Flp family type IVb pilin n=1 Tax=Arsenicitalea aurantiaca TaxID=1783274 RepID=A0A433X257_9HYPH|nr:Flp family type IVb pilin [Arsenicitalea aurantiaca]RUT28194.1 Flp family type IVb pilin [Arsenicitalea aurantiaca]
MIDGKSRSLVQDQSGATAIEYALIASLLSIVILGAVFVLGNGLAGTYEMVRDEVVAVTPAPGQ